MANSPSFVDHALDLLSLVGPVEARRMFGGHGVYVRGVMFGLLDDDELFLKTDLESRPRFQEAGCRMWVYPDADETSYWRPPDDAHEDGESMLPWARLGLEAALRIRAAKDAEARARAARRTEREAKAATRKKAATGKKVAAGKKRSTPARKRSPARRGR